MSTKTDEKRLAYAERAANALEHGVIPWQSAAIPSVAPESAVSGRPYKGINALYLVERVREEGFVDSRWLTVKDANKDGYNVKAGSKGASVEYWGTKDGKMESQSYSVFNVEQLEPSPAREPDIRPNYDKADAILKNAGFEIPQSRNEYAYSAALEKTLVEAGQTTPLFSDVHTQDLKAMRISMAGTFLMWDTNIRVSPDVTRDTTQSWAASIKRNPTELFKAVRDAGKLVGEITQGLGLDLEQQAQPHGTLEKKKTKATAIIPKIGDRVTFRAKGSEENAPAITGEVVGMDDHKGTVTLKCGGKNIPVFRGKGSFFEAPPLEQEATKEYAQNLARKHAGENGKVFFARDEGVYKGVIVETTPTFAIQKVQEGMAVLHRLKDLGQENNELVEKGRNIVINKEVGKVTVSPNQNRQEQTAGVER